jgi:hypothetical protein
MEGHIMGQFAIADKDRPRYDAACVWLGAARAVAEFIARGGRPDQVEGTRYSITLRGTRGSLRDSFDSPATLTALDNFTLLVCEWESGKIVDRATVVAAYYISEDTIRDIKRPIEQAAALASIPDKTKLIAVLTASSLYPEWDPFANAISASNGDTPAAPTVRMTKPGDIPAGPLGGNNRVVHYANDERDQYILSRKREPGVTFKMIVSEIKAHAGWQRLDDVKGVHEALTRYCDRTGEIYPGTQKRKKHKQS